MKIAIIGAGIAGNTLAWKLHRHHRVTVFEAGSHLGGHTHTHHLELEGRQTAVDSGFIVFNDRTYPNFNALLAELDVSRQATDMSFSVHCEASGLEYAGTNLDSLFAQRSNLVNPRFYRLIADILRFNRRAPALLDCDDDDITLGDYLRDERYGDYFKRYYILPMGAAIWSQPLDAMLAFPARFFIRFFANHGLLSINDRPQWYVVKGGSCQYVDSIYRQFSGEVRLNTPVERVQRYPDRTVVTAGQRDEVFDAVFFACHADTALALLADASDLEKRTLGAFPFQSNTAVLHTGDNLLPRRRKARSSWNYRLPATEAAGGATVTYDMKRLQSLPLQGDVCVTLNGGDTLPREQVLASMTYRHPVFTLPGVRAQRDMHLINGAMRTYYCGAYWRYGFHEDGVVSALAALEHFNQRVEDDGQVPVQRAG